MNNTTLFSTAQTIKFYNQYLITFEQNGTYYTAMKPICENIGLNWASQYQRIQRDDVLNQGVVIITIPTNSGIQQMLCLPIEYLNGWLFGIDVKRVKPEIRDLLITYKKECYKALADYWMKGKAQRALLLDKLEVDFLFSEHYAERLACIFDTCDRLATNMKKILPHLDALGVKLADLLQMDTMTYTLLQPEIQELRNTCKNAQKLRYQKWEQSEKQIKELQLKQGLTNCLKSCLTTHDKRV